MKNEKTAINKSGQKSYHPMQIKLNDFKNSVHWRQEFTREKYNKVKCAWIHNKIQENIRLIQCISVEWLASCKIREEKGNRFFRESTQVEVHDYMKN